MMTRTEIINAYIKKYGFKSYLEIGVQSGKNFEAVVCENKVGIDPDKQSRASLIMPSDDFFHYSDSMVKYQGMPPQKFDLIFIDGLHESEQVYRDIENSFMCLNDNGIIIVHDCNPVEEIHQRVPRETKIWNGDAWKAFVRFRANGLEQFVIDTDYGCGVITTKQVKPFSTDLPMDWTTFDKHRKELLNLISITEWMKTM